MTSPMTSDTPIRRVINAFMPLYGSIPKLSAAMGLHRSALHQAMRRKSLSVDMQRQFIALAKQHDIKLDVMDLISAD